MAIQPHRETFAVDNLLSRGQKIAVDVSEEEATDVILAPGQMSLHHVNIVHKSNANTSDKKRIGFAARYITPSVNNNDYHQPVVLARGEDTHGNFEPLKDPPNTRDMQSVVEAHLRTTREHREGILSNEASNQDSED